MQRYVQNGVSRFLMAHQHICAVWTEYHAAHAEVGSVRRKRIASVMRRQLLMNNDAFTDSDQQTRSTWYLYLYSSTSLKYFVDMLPYTTVQGEAFQRLNFSDPAKIKKVNLQTFQLLMVLKPLTTSHKNVVQVRAEYNLISQLLMLSKSTLTLTSYSHIQWL